MFKALIAIEKLLSTGRRVSFWRLSELLLAALLTGCSNHSTSSNPPPAASPAASTPAEAGSAADTGTALASLTQAVRKYAIEHKQVPTTFDELIAAGYITGLPPAPPGQKFVINPKGVQVILMKQ